MVVGSEDRNKQAGDHTVYWFLCAGSHPILSRDVPNVMKSCVRDCNWSYGVRLLRLVLCALSSSY